MKRNKEETNSVSKGKITFSPGLSWNSKTCMQTTLERASKPWGKINPRGFKVTRMDGLELTPGWRLQVQLVSKLLVVRGVSTTEQQHKNVGQKKFLGTALFQILVLQVTALRKEPRWASARVKSPTTFLLTSGTEEPALRAEALLPKAFKSCGKLARTWETLLIKGFPLELFAFGLTQSHLFWCTQQTPWGKLSHP